MALMRISWFSVRLCTGRVDGRVNDRVLGRAHGQCSRRCNGRVHCRVRVRGPYTANDTARVCSRFHGTYAAVDGLYGPCTQPVHGHGHGPYTLHVTDS